MQPNGMRRPPLQFLSQIHCSDGDPRGGGRDAVEGKGSQRRPPKRSDRRLAEVAKAVGGGYCRLQMPLKPALGVSGTVAGHCLGALDGGLPPPPPPMHPWGGGYRSQDPRPLPTPPQGEPPVTFIYSSYRPEESTVGHVSWSPPPTKPPSQPPPPGQQSVGGGGGAKKRPGETIYRERPQPKQCLTHPPRYSFPSLLLWDADVAHHRRMTSFTIITPPWSRQTRHGLGVCIWMHLVNCGGNSQSLGQLTPDLSECARARGQ